MQFTQAKDMFDYWYEEEFNLPPISQKEYEEERIKQIYDEYRTGDGTIGDVAYAHGIPRSTLAYKFKEYGLPAKPRNYREQTRSVTGVWKKDIFCGVKKVRKIYQEYQDNPEITVTDLAYRYNIRPRTLLYLFNKYNMSINAGERKRFMNSVKRSLREWSDAEVRILINMVRDGESTPAFLAEFNRSTKEVQQKLRELGVQYLLPSVHKEKKILVTKA